MNYPRTSLGLRVAAATALALALPLSAAPAHAARPAPTVFTVNCVASTNLMDNQAWVTAEPVDTNWVTDEFTTKSGVSIDGAPSAFEPSGFGVRPPAIMASTGGTVTATAWTDESGIHLGTATGKCQAKKSQFAVTCVANSVDEGAGRAAETNPPPATGVVFYDFYDSNGVHLGAPMYSFMVHRGAAVITPVGATSVTAKAWITTGAGDPPQLGDQVGEATSDCL